MDGGGKDLTALGGTGKMFLVGESFRIPSGIDWFRPNWLKESKALNLTLYDIEFGVIQRFSVYASVQEILRAENIPVSSDFLVWDLDVVELRGKLYVSAVSTIQSDAQVVVLQLLQMDETGIVSTWHEVHSVESNQSYSLEMVVHGGRLLVNLLSIVTSGPSAGVVSTVREFDSKLDQKRIVAYIDFIDTYLVHFEFTVQVDPKRNVSTVVSGDSNMTLFGWNMWPLGHGKAESFQFLTWSLSVNSSTGFVLLEGERMGERFFGFLYNSRTMNAIPLWNSLLFNSSVFPSFGLFIKNELVLFGRLWGDTESGSYVWRIVLPKGGFTLRAQTLTFVSLGVAGLLAWLLIGMFNRRKMRQIELFPKKKEMI